MNSSGDALAPLRSYLANRLPPVTTPYVAGVIGDHPSTYSRSPAIWNAAFAGLRLPATFVPFDVRPERLEAFLEAGRAASALLGVTVTVPYKERVLPLLDHIPGFVGAIGAVNVIARDRQGGWVGGNTDGEGALSALQRLIAGRSGGAPGTVLLLGAGGAAKAVAAAVAMAYPDAALTLSNRSRERTEALVQTIRQSRSRGTGTGTPVTVSSPDEWESLLPQIDVVVNATSIGMSGPIRINQEVTWLEPFSPLARADPPLMPAATADASAPPREWWERAWPAISTNLERSLRRALRLSPEAVVLDLVYAPSETVLLKHARWTGHDATNGLNVLIGQAVSAFTCICEPLLGGRDPDTVRDDVARAMRAALP